MGIVLEQVFLLMIFIVIGYILSKSKKADSSHAKLLSTLEVYVFLPATIFNSFSKNCTPAYLSAKYPLILVAISVLVLTALFSKCFAKLMTKDRYQQNILRYSLTIPNYVYVGYALAGGIFGSEVLLDVMLFTLPFSAYTHTAGYCMLTNSKLSLKRLANPVTLSVAAGMIVGLLGIRLPQLAGTLLSKAAACMGPVSMLLAGIAISEYSLKTLLRNKTVYIIVLLRLAVLPLVAALMLKLLGLEQFLLPAIMVLAMPCGLNTIVFPKLIGEDCQIGAGLAFVSNILCCITIPLCLLLFGFTAG